jgi:hypothetical protein
MLNILFPPQLGRVDISGYVLLQRIANKEIAVVEDVSEAGIVRVDEHEYVEGHWQSRRIR